MNRQIQLCFAFLFSYLFLLQLFINVSSVDAQAATEFSYDETTGLGPSQWGSLNPAWTACGVGQMQSPIGINFDEAVRDPTLNVLISQYVPVPAVATQTAHGLKIILKGDGGGLVINGIYYKLIQFHWHWGSEHVFNGQSLDMELHMVHQNGNTTAVIGILFKLGNTDATLADLLPRTEGLNSGELDIGIIDPEIINIDRTNYVRYMGSFTTPPCTEGVIWTVIKTINEVDPNQLGQLISLSPDQFGSTARPLQDVNGRLISSFDTMA